MYSDPTRVVNGLVLVPHQEANSRVIADGKFTNHEGLLYFSWCSLFFAVTACYCLCMTRIRSNFVVWVLRRVRRSSGMISL